MPKIELISKEYKDEIEGVRERIKEKAIRFIRETMPAKVIEINNLLQTPKWNIDRSVIRNYTNFDALDKLVEEKNTSYTSSKKRMAPPLADDEPVTPAEFSSNELVMEVVEVMKNQMLDILDIVATIKTWIQLNIPQIEDGNNFGVSVQEDTVGELTRTEESVYNNLQLSFKYYLHRAKYLTKVLKYPSIADYRQSIREIDEKEYTNTVILMNDLKNNYSILHDLITKNWHKISNPRSQNNPLF